MADLTSEYSGAVELVVEVHRELQTLDPEHELLEYVTGVTDTGFSCVEDKYREFLDRFETHRSRKLSLPQTLGKYYVAMRNAVAEMTPTPSV